MKTGACINVALLVVTMLSVSSPLFSQTPEKKDAGAEAKATAEAEAKAAAQAKANTTDVLRNSTIAQRYYYFQQSKENKPNAAGFSTLTLDGGPKAYYAPQLKQAVEADGTYQPFGAIFDLLGSFGDAGNGSVPSAQTGIQTQVFGTLT